MVRVAEGKAVAAALVAAKEEVVMEAALVAAKEEVVMEAVGAMAVGALEVVGRAAETAAAARVAEGNVYEGYATEGNANVEYGDDGDDVYVDYGHAPWDDENENHPRCGILRGMAW